MAGLDIDAGEGTDGVADSQAVCAGLLGDGGDLDEIAVVGGQLDRERDLGDGLAGLDLPLQQRRVLADVHADGGRGHGTGDVQLKQVDHAGVLDILDQTGRIIGIGHGEDADVHGRAALLGDLELTVDPHVAGHGGEQLHVDLADGLAVVAMQEHSAVARMIRPVLLGADGLGNDAADPGFAGQTHGFTVPARRGRCENQRIAVIDAAVIDR